MFFCAVRRLFERGNVCVTGLRGTGKDMLIANVVVRRKSQYVSNVDYGGDMIPFVPHDFDCGKNSYSNFVEGNIKYYSYPFSDGVDLYISDAGVYFPSQFCNELNNKYKYFPNFFALSRQLGDCNVHINVQNLNRCWDKIREQSDQYIRCCWCRVLFGKIVLQKIRIYELYDSCISRVPPFRLSRPLLGNARVDAWKMERERYYQKFGEVQEGLLLYINRSNYDTRIFKKILEGGVHSAS